MAVSEAGEYRDNIFKGTGLGKLNLQPDYSFFLLLLKRERGRGSTHQWGHREGERRRGRESLNQARHPVQSPRQDSVSQLRDHDLS